MLQMGFVVPQVYQFLDVASALRSATSITYEEDGVWVTHSETHIEDLKDESDAGRAIGRLLGLAAAYDAAGLMRQECRADPMPAHSKPYYPRLSIGTKCRSFAPT